MPPFQPQLVSTPAVLVVGRELLAGRLPFTQGLLQRPTEPWNHQVLSLNPDVVEREATLRVLRSVAEQRKEWVILTPPQERAQDVAAAHIYALEGLTVLRSMGVRYGAFYSEQLDVPRIISHLLPGDVRHLAARFAEESDRMLQFWWTFLIRNGHVAATAKALSMHPNTVRYHLERWALRTGLNLRESMAITKATLSLLALRMLEPGRFAEGLGLWSEDA